MSKLDRAFLVALILAILIAFPRGVIRAAGVKSDVEKEVADAVRTIQEQSEAEQRAYAAGWQACKDFYLENGGF